MKWSNSVICLSLISSLLASSCSNNSSSNKKSFLTKISLNIAELFSTRQQSPTSYVGLIQLHSPALLASAKIVNGKAIIDEESKNTINSEHENAIDALKNLSPNIVILGEYKMVLNAISFVAPSELAEKISKLEGVEKVEASSNFERPVTMSSEETSTSKTILGDGIDVHNTITFLGADKLHQLGITGKGMRIGIIDTGIDYTHSMFKGPGKKEIYESINPATANEFFPNDLIIGGKDFVGSDFAPSSEDPEKRIPKPDSNPIDEAGHGTHVAGTVAGAGDNQNTYSGVAPDAKLYALKVFGKKGGTSDIVVIQALEYAADPSESLNPNQRLDVVNLSLGGGFGKPKVLYTEAVKNLTRGGTVVVASAGNSGDNPYIVGAPSTSEQAISVAASVDDMSQNIAFDAGEFAIGNSTKLIEIVEGNVTLPSRDSHVKESLVYLGNGKDPIADEVKNAVKGKIALMDRGVISFAEKFTLAESLGAAGVIMANNQEGSPIKMGGDKKFNFPAVMISKALGEEIKLALKNSEPVVFDFSSDKVIKHEELVDTITGFSSRGPRSIDSLIKPEIAAPGSNVISAQVGSGTLGVKLSGTSMAGPHMAGVMTLLKQAFPNLTVEQLKAKILNHSKILMKDNVHVPVSLQGAGRVQIENAFQSPFIIMPATLSLGEVSVSSNKTIAKTLTIYNSSNSDIVLTSKAIKSKNVSVSLPGSFKVKANGSTKVTVSFTLLRAKDDQNNIESDGFVQFISGDGKFKMNVPFLAVLNKVTNIEASDFVTMTNSSDDKAGSEVRLTLTNKGQNSGDALIFNLLGIDERKIVAAPLSLSKSKSCDLEAAGLRIVEKTIDGENKKFLQVGIKLYDSLTMWQPCDISMQIDTDHDDVADLELVGIKANYVSGIPGDGFTSLLLDAKAAREVRKDFELNPANNKENYSAAVISQSEMKYYNHGSVAVVEADLSKIETNKKGMVRIKLAVSNLETDSDDFLDDHAENWKAINLSENSFAFYDMPEAVSVNANDLEKVSMRRGAGKARLLILYPHNAPAINDLTNDRQAQILTEKLLP
jgi:minor extracellular serine protease Vpr